MAGFENVTNEGNRPFEYMILDNFLTDRNFSKVEYFYNELSFKEVHTDLFRFLQSNELFFEEKIKFFKRELDKVFQDKNSSGDAYYSMFASYYREGDFLLCHDDMVDERMYAFTFYLEDFDSGQLLLFENDCQTVHKRIDVRKNRLVIFKVESKSFHEVDICLKDGRKALSGWFNVPNKKNLVFKRQKSYSVAENIELFDLEVDIDNQDFIFMEFEDIAVKEVRRQVQGPFIDRRCVKIEYEKLYAPRFNGYELIHCECLEFRESDYILANDLINLENSDSIMDVFIFKCSENVPDFIFYSNNNSELGFTVDALDSHLFIGKRKGKNVSIHRSKKTVLLKHFMYYLRH